MLLLLLFTCCAAIATENIIVTTCETTPCAFTSSGRPVNMGKNRDLEPLADAGRSWPKIVIGKYLYISRTSPRPAIVKYDIVDGWTVSEKFDVTFSSYHEYGCKHIWRAHHAGKHVMFDLVKFDVITVDPKRGFNDHTCRENDIPAGGVFMHTGTNGNLVIYKTPAGYFAYDPRAPPKIQHLRAYTTSDASKIIVKYTPDGFDNYAGTVAVNGHPYVQNAQMLVKIIEDIAAGDPGFAVSSANLDRADGKKAVEITITFNIKYVDTPFSMILEVAGDRVDALERKVDHLMKKLG